MRSYTMPFSLPSSSRETPTSEIDPKDTKSHHGKHRTSERKRRQSFATDTTNYESVAGSWGPVLSREPASTSIPNPPSITPGHTLHDQNLLPHKLIIQAEAPPKEKKCVRFGDSDTIQEPDDEEEELEWSDCMQRRLEQQLWYPYYHGYTHQGGPALLPSPIQIPVQGRYAAHPMFLRTSPIPLWAPGYHPVGPHSVVLNQYARY